MTSQQLCRAKGGSASCTDPECPERKAFMAEFTSPVPKPKALAEKAWPAIIRLPKKTQARMFTEYTRSGNRVSVQGGVIDRTSVGLYRSGQCFALAAVLVEAKVGTPVLARDRKTGVIAHALVKVPSGQLLDIDGFHDAAEVSVNYDLEPQTADQFTAEVWQREGWARWADPQNRPLARTMIRPIVRNYLGVDA